MMYAHSSRTMAGAKRLAETRRPDRSREEVTVREPDLSMYNPAFLRRVAKKHEQQERIRQRDRDIEERRKQRELDARKRIADLNRILDEDERKAAEEKARREAEAARLVDEAVARYQCVHNTDAKRSAKDIIREVCLGTGWTLADIVGERRHKDLVVVRHACIYAVAKEYPDKSLPALGRIFKRDHSSILHALRKKVVLNKGHRG